MVGIHGREGKAVDQLQLVCAPLQSNGALGTSLRVTARHGGDGGRAFLPRRCVTGQAVNAVSVSLSGYTLQLRALLLQCEPLNSFGLVTADNTDGVMGPVGTISKDGYLLGWDRCTRNRPARAMRVNKGIFEEEFTALSPVAVNVVTGVQLICEQPVRPTQ